MIQQTVPAWVQKIAAFLRNNKHVKFIYINGVGDYHVNAVPGFEKVSVSEFLAEVDQYEEPTDTALPMVEENNTKNIQF